MVLKMEDDLSGLSAEEFFRKGQRDLSKPLEVDAALRKARESYVDRGFESLPQGLRNFVIDHDKYVGCKTVGISIGPGRGETMLLNQIY